MYPNLYYAFRDLFGVEWTGLQFVNSFGFFVALAFIIAGWALTKELKRKERAGLLPGKDVKIVVGKPAGTGELLLNFLLGFLLGYKILGLFLADRTIASDPQSFIFSSEGSWPAGILLGALMAGMKYWEKNKQKLSKPEERTVRLWPHDRVGDMVIYALVFGFLGAKIFDNLENWDRFIEDPIGNLLSFSGLTFYGGLICAAIAIWFYARKHDINFKHLCDAFAPALMLAYCVGRMGCQVAGDGDWGILNSAYVTDPVTSKAVRTDNTGFQKTLQASSAHYQREFPRDSLDQIPHKSVQAPSWLPVWMVAYAYPHNVVNAGVPIPGCQGEKYCEHLPVPVFPTPFYEIVMALLLFILLWSIRKKIKIPGQLFAIYLIINGLERFFIEKIRVNTKYDGLPFQPTQAELISSFLVLAGIVLWVWLQKKYSNTSAPINSSR